MRGEKWFANHASSRTRGSPPRARGEATSLAASAPELGITPACAGRSASQSYCSCPCRDHPRVRGEKYPGLEEYKAERGSPPRARGEGDVAQALAPHPGITPACAGRSGSGVDGDVRREDHPRVRGEKPLEGRAGGGVNGSPPRARGEGKAGARPALPPRITPACAGRRAIRGHYTKHYMDHPRVRGEKDMPKIDAGIPYGSPPRARGEGGDIGDNTGFIRITPACAGRSAPERAR